MSLDPKQIERLPMLRGLSDRVIRYLAEQGWQEQRLPGEDLCDSREDQSAAFLAKGRIVLHGPETRVIESETPEAGFPLEELKQEGTVSMVCQGPVQLMRIPEELIEGIRNFWASNQQQVEGIELREDDLGDRIYMDFYSRLKAGDYELPSMPDIAVRIGRVVENPDTDSGDLARVILSDPPLATRVIRTANSPAFGGTTSVDNCKDAVTRLGRENTRNLVTSYLLKHLFQCGDATFNSRMQRLWYHSRRVAAISQVLARMSPGMIPERAMLAGLIHDIGAIPILTTAADYPNLCATPEKLDTIIDSLKAEIGALTLRSWDFEPELVDVTLHCEAWFRDQSEVADYTDLVIVAQLFSYVGSQDMQKLPPPDLSPAFHKLVEGRLTPLLSLSVLNEAEKEINDVEELLEGG